MRVHHSARVKEGVTRDFTGDQSNYVAQTGRGVLLCVAKKSRISALRLPHKSLAIASIFKIRSFFLYFYYETAIIVEQHL